MFEVNLVHTLADGQQIDHEVSAEDLSALEVKIEAEIQQFLADGIEIVSTE